MFAINSIDLSASVEPNRNKRNACKAYVRNLIQDAVKLGKPLLLRNALPHLEWPAAQWNSIEQFALRFPNRKSTFRCYTRRQSQINNSSSDVPPVYEINCEYRQATFEEFNSWLNQNMNCGNPFEEFPLHNSWIYCDYKEITSILSKEEILEEVNFEKLLENSSDVDSLNSTIWIGSKGANTPLHYDTYSSNIIVQLGGKKKWVLFEPEQTEYLYPTRIPYEESSVFSEINLELPPSKVEVLFPKSLKTRRCTLELNEGDMLYLPKHWWHYVECMTNSISINLWINEKSDDKDRLSEAIIRLFLSTFKTAEKDSIVNWLNPTETNYDYHQNLDYLNIAMSHLYPSDRLSNRKVTTNDLIHCLTSEEAIYAIQNQLYERMHAKSKETSKKEEKEIKD